MENKTVRVIHVTAHKSGLKIKQGEPETRYRFAQEELKALRKEKGITLLLAGVAMGIDPSYLSRLERQKQMANCETLTQVEDFYKVKAEIVTEDAVLPLDNATLPR